MALVFAFVLDWRIGGLWFGFFIACLVLDIGYQCIISCGSWEAIAKRVKSRMEEDQKRKEDAMSFEDREVEEIISKKLSKSFASLNASVIRN